MSNELILQAFTVYQRERGQDLPENVQRIKERIRKIGRIIDLRAMNFHAHLLTIRSNIPQNSIIIIIKKHNKMYFTVFF